MVSGTEFVLACIFVGSVTLFGVFLMFSKPENIERPTIVGAITLATDFIAMLLLHNFYKSMVRVSGFDLSLICLLSIVGFGVGKFVDVQLGARSERFVEDPILGSDLSD